MPVGSNGKSPSYISSHSADVILSDIRPIKLKIEGLTCINVFLDEFLYGILSAARSLTTDKLRAGLLSVLPTALGKEALLEAEVELRAYWDRTKPSKNGAVDDDAATFNLQWAFELLRLKCEAYSTLNESDGDKSAETRLHERFASAGQPPKPSLVAPAALYLTAILEAIHVLSNVGRVASRDSSRTYASVQDVFVALCEDETIYNLFKSMDVYEQIEQLSQAPKPRRSKSFSRNDKNISRTSSTNHDHSSGKDSPPGNNRLSSDGMPSGSNRSSFDRAKSMKKLINGRSSSSNDSVSNGHKRSESALSDETKQNWAAYGSFDVEEQASLQEFDDLMKSDATMKVSLTPDRLKTMEVYKQEKERGGRTKPAPLHTANLESESSTPSVPPRAASRRPSAPNVESIVEDEEELVTTKPTHPRVRQTSVVSPPPKSLPPANTRARSQSAAAQRKPPKTILSDTSSPPAPMMQTREFRAPQGFDGPGFPQKTRKIQRARESLDLDDVMGGSDDEDMDDTQVVSPSKSFTSVTPSQSSKVSARTRELMDFLNEGPPPTSSNSAPSRLPANGPPVSKAGRELMEFLAQGPPDYGPPPSAMDNGSVKSKGSGRLQRMISKLKLTDDKGSRNGQQSLEDFRKTPTTPSYSRPPLAMKASNGSLSALGNRPVPPRPPQPQMISPPSSPIRETVDLPPVTSPAPRSRQPSAAQSVNRKATAWDQDTPISSIPASAQPAPAVVQKVVQQPVSIRSLPSRPPENVRKEYDLEDTKPLAPLPKASPVSSTPAEKPSIRVETKKSTARASPSSIQTAQSDRKALTPEAPSPAAIPPASSPVANGISIVDAQDMKRLLLKATTPEECRLITDMFLAKAGIPVEPANYDVPYPSPSPSDATEKNRPSSGDIALEIALVELFLGSEPSHEPAPRKKRYTTKKVRVDTQAANNHQKSPISATNGNAVHAPPPIAVSEVALKA
ncbi:hypothetical protein BT96DRAFT_988929 [Gymnopus androsaceus JB14]|uniref:Uncharacterized protein n=1 Tax=Gymnopus androsaceus JB14 TaxID=1447944 RepID=A0A6A4I5Z3_9AGAR|nr:hypothetical protein BT96DRAFT_988929 [Gymnopus androsaceus JB14]